LHSGEPKSLKQKEIPTINKLDIDSHTTLNFKFLVLPGFSLVPYATAIDILRLANRNSGKTLYSWQTISPTKDIVYSSSNLAIYPEYIFTGNEECDLFFVCGGTKIASRWEDSIGTKLRSIDAKGIDIGAVCTGTFILAMAGLLDNYRCTIHWQNLSATREKFPLLNLTDDVFEVDRNRYTCAGGITSIDLMFRILVLQQNQELAASVIETILVERVRSMSDTQVIPLRQKLGTNQPKLESAVKLMETNIEEPLNPSDIARLVNISRRQLERLFNSHLNSTPTRYYLELRLKNARRLLLQTGLPIIEISLVCGFSSAPHFSKCYRDLFERSPSEERRLFLVPLEPLEPTLAPPIL
jgi:transcriptional regulator GlxA family with amidase domain